MRIKSILGSLIVGTAVVAIGFGSMVYFSDDTKPSASTRPIATYGSQDTGGLKVDSSFNINGGIQQQNGGQTSTQSNATTTPATSVPGPEAFSQYDKYAAGTGALYGDINIGTGAEVGTTSKIAVYYKGWLTNGSLFDQSQIDPKTGQLQPFVFTMGAHSVIIGWEQGIYGMKVGGKRRLIIPPAVGYGEQGHDPIPGKAVLVFDVELIAVQ